MQVQYCLTMSKKIELLQVIHVFRVIEKLCKIIQITFRFHIYLHIEQHMYVYIRSGYKMEGPLRLGPVCAAKRFDFFFLEASTAAHCPVEEQMYFPREHSLEAGNQLEAPCIN